MIRFFIKKDWLFAFKGITEISFTYSKNYGFILISQAIIVAQIKLFLKLSTTKKVWKQRLNDLIINKKSQFSIV